VETVLYSVGWGWVRGLGEWLDLWTSVSKCRMVEPIHIGLGGWLGLEALRRDGGGVPRASPPSRRPAAVAANILPPHLSSTCPVYLSGVYPGVTTGSLYTNGDHERGLLGFGSCTGNLVATKRGPPTPDHSAGGGEAGSKCLTRRQDAPPLDNRRSVSFAAKTHRLSTIDLSTIDVRYRSPPRRTASRQSTAGKRASVIVRRHGAAPLASRPDAAYRAPAVVCCVREPTPPSKVHFLHPLPSTPRRRDGFLSFQADKPLPALRYGVCIWGKSLQQAFFFSP